MSAAEIDALWWAIEFGAAVLGVFVVLGFITGEKW
jgi:hypothetical protein